jgi:putative cardiolipin synthase
MMLLNLVRLTCAASLLLAGCASVPRDFEQIPSQAWEHPETTTIGKYFDNIIPKDGNYSGVRLIRDPREAFMFRFGFAAQAENTLDLQYYLWKADTTGTLLLHQVFEAADRGVKVRLLIDDIYHSGRDLAYATIDAHPNIQVRVYNPIGNRGRGRNLNLLFNQSQLNYRMHNKIFLVDNAVAVLGGRNIGDDYFGMNPKLNFHDLDVLAVGPAAEDAGSAFDLYWNSPRAAPISELVTRELAPDAMENMRRGINENLDENLAAVPYSVPLDKPVLTGILDNLSNEMQWAETEIVVDTLDRFEGGSTSAFVILGERLSRDVQDEVIVQTAYLIPTDEGIANIRALTDRGVRFRILTNSLMSNNHISVHAHYMKYRKPLIEAGVELYELRADNELLEYYKEVESKVADSHAGLHTKAFVVDGATAMIGSYNMDPRSRIWNSEIGLLVHNPDFAGLVRADMLEEFEPGNAYRVSLNEKGKIEWTIDGPDGKEVFSKEPGASVWRRMLARLISWIPIENQL